MPNKLEVTLSFKPLMDGLDRFVNAIESRMERVRALNLRLENGAKATNQLLAQAATVLGINQLKTYVDKAGESVKSQAQLITAAAKQGVYSRELVDTLNDHADALERVTNFEGEEISAVQRQLISYRVTRRELAGMTEATLDLAAALNTNATSAALLIGKTLQGDQEELGRYGIRIDQTKNRVVALREAIQRFAGGQARAQVAFPELRRAAVEIDAAQKALGRSLAGALGPLIGGFATGLRNAADSLGKISGYVGQLGFSAENLRPLGELLGKATVAALALLAPLLALRALLVGLPAVINPARMAFVFLAGVDFVDAIRDVQMFTRELGLIQTLQVANWAQRFAAFGAVVAAAFAGWQIGSFINQLHVGGMTIGDWTARTINWFIGWGDRVGAAAQTAWVLLKFNFLEKLTEARITILEFVGFVSTQLNKILPSKWQIPTDSIKAAIAEYRKELGKLDAEKEAALIAIEQRLKANLDFRSGVDADLAARGRAGVTPAPTAPVVNGVPEDITKSKEARAKELAEIKAALELERLQADQAYDLKILDLEAYFAKRFELLQRAIAAEKKLSDTPPGRNAVALAIAQEAADQAKERRERLEKEKQLKLAEEEQTLTEKLGAIAQRRAAIEGDLYTTAEAKRPRLLAMLREENGLLDEKIRKLDVIIAQELDPEKRLKFRQEREQAAQQRADNQRSIEQSQPQTIVQGLTQGISGQGGFLESLGTSAQIAASTIRGTLQTAVDGISNGIYGWITGTQSWRQTLTQIGASVLQQIIRGVVQIGVQWALSKVLRAEEAKQTQAAIGAKGLEAGMKSIAQLGPIYGPPAFAAASAAVLGLSTALASFGGFRADGGPVQAGRTYIVGERGPEPFVPASDGYIFPSAAAMDSALANSMTRPSSGGRAAGGAAAGGGFDPERVNFTVINVTSEREATRIARQSRARGDIVRIVQEDFGLPPKRA